jgi:hypothetical protein
MAASLKQKTHKVLDIEVEGFNIVCVVHYEQATNPFHLYVKWYDGKWCLKQLARYQNFFSVVCAVKDWMQDRHIGFGDCFL